MTIDKVMDIILKISLGPVRALLHDKLLVASAAAIVAGLAVGLLALVFRAKSRKKDTTSSRPGPVPHPVEKKQTPPPACDGYGMITDRIRRVEKKYKSILFAGVDIHCLPVTVPVNVAMQLCQQDKRCLLVDLDLRRDAVAKAFELPPGEEENEPRLRAISAGVPNLWLWPAHNFTRLKQMNIRPIVAKAQEKFDFVLINAPHLTESPDRKQIAAAAQAALVFSHSSAQATSLADFIRTCNCALIASIQVPARP